MILNYCMVMDKMDAAAFKDEYLKLAEQFSKLTQTKGKELLKLVTIKGTGYSFYYAPRKAKFMRINKKDEMYLLPYAKDDKDRHYVFIPKGSAGIIILVSDDEIEIHGYN